MDEMIFWGKNFILKFLGEKGSENGSKMKFFKSHEKSMHETLLLFCMKLQQHQGLELTQVIFSGKILSRVFGQKVANMSFVSFITN